MNIDELEGRELDRHIAEHLGYQGIQTSPDPDTLLYTCRVQASTGQRYELYPDVPHFHRDIAAAMKLWDELGEAGWICQLRFWPECNMHFAEFWCHFHNETGEVVPFASNVPYESYHEIVAKAQHTEKATAIARAYLKARVAR